MASLNFCYADSTGRRFQKGLRVPESTSLFIAVVAALRTNGMRVFGSSLESQTAAGILREVNQQHPQPAAFAERR